MARTGRRVFRIDLGALERGERAECLEWTPESEGLARIGSFGGSALGVVLLREELRRSPEAAPALVLAVGDGVRRGLPTAARATVLSRAPLTGRLAEGHVGGDLGARLASFADAVVVRGRASRPCAVLRLLSDGSARLESRPELERTSPARAIEALSRGAPAAVLTIGPAGERGLPFASLASGAPRPSFVGRGGLGAVLSGLGLKAIVVAAPIGSEPGSAREARDEREARALLQALTRSPRLAARAEGGTLELYGALAASGGLRGRDFEEELPRSTARVLDGEAREKRVERAGCAGCPTPCGWVFEGSEGMRQRAHFGATYALGTNLGLRHLDDALSLLARCDELGLDAKEVGGILALEARARERGFLPGPPGWGDRERLLARIDAIVFGGEEAAALRDGVSALARRFGLAGAAAESQGEAAAREANHAAVLGRAVSTGGADPMRSFPFLVGASGRGRLADLCADLGPLPAGAEDPASPAGKGRLVFWHENLVAAVDATGFCSFSTAGLLADGVVDLGELARWILPRDWLAPDDPEWAVLAPERRLLALGANVVLARREIDRVLGERDTGRRGTSADPEGWLARPGMLEEYRRWRGLDEEGHVRAEVRARLGTPAVLDLVGAAGGEAGSESARASCAVRPTSLAEGSAERRAPPAHGRVELRASSTAFVDMELPARLLEVLARAESSQSSLCGRLVSRGQPIPAVWRAGERLDADALVVAGDVLELVTAISGG